MIDRGGGMQWDGNWIIGGILFWDRFGRGEREGARKHLQNKPDWTLPSVSWQLDRVRKTSFTAVCEPWTWYIMDAQFFHGRACQIGYWFRLNDPLSFCRDHWRLELINESLNAISINIQQSGLAVCVDVPLEKRQSLQSLDECPEFHYFYNSQQSWP